MSEIDRGFKDKETPWKAARVALGNRVTHNEREGYKLDGRPVTVQRIMKEAEKAS